MAAASSRRRLRMLVRYRALADTVRRRWCGCPLALRMLAAPALCMILLLWVVANGWRQAGQVRHDAVELASPAAAAGRAAALQRLQSSLAHMQVDVHRLAGAEAGPGGQLLADMLRTRLQQELARLRKAPLPADPEQVLEHRVSAYLAQVEVALAQLDRGQPGGVPAAGNQMAGNPVAGNPVAGNPLTGALAAGTQTGDTQVASMQAAGTQVTGAHVSGRIAADLAAARHAALRTLLATKIAAEQRQADAAQAALEQALSRPDGAYWPLALALALLAVLSAALSAWLALKPLQRLAPAMTRLAGGDTQLGDLGAHRQDDLGAMAAAVAVFQRNTMELQAAQQALQAAQSQLASVIQAMPNGVAVFDSAQRLVLFNEPFVQLVEMPRAALAGQRWVELALRMTQADGDTAEWEHAVNCWFDSPGRTLRHEVRLGQHWLLFACNRIDGRHMQGGGLVLVLTDLTRRKQMEEELRQLALNDALTRLPNRRLFMDRLAHAAQASQRRNSHGAVLFIDLNKFKQLNDQHGHEAGDLLLMEVAHRLLLAARASDTVARLGGDEFVVLAEGLGEDRSAAEAAAGILAGKLQDALDAPYLLGALLHHGSASIGVSVFLGGEMDAAAILREADAAMYRDKSHRASHL